MKVYAVLVSLNSRGIRENIIPIDAKETEKCYITSKKRISKEKLMSDLRIFHNQGLEKRYSTYCLEDKIPDALLMLKTWCIKSFMDDYKAATEIYSTLDTSLLQKIYYSN